MRRFLCLCLLMVLLGAQTGYARLHMIADFDTQIFVVSDITDFLRQWYTSKGTLAPTPSTFYPGEKLRIVPVLKGGGVDTSFRQEVFGNFVINHPDGETFLHVKQELLWSEGELEKTYSLPQSMLSFVLPPDAPTGNWTIKAKVWDNDSEQTKELTVNFIVASGARKDQ